MHYNALPVLVLAVKVMLSEMLMLAAKVALQTGLHGDELSPKLRWWKPGVATRADLVLKMVVKMVGRKKMAMREVRRKMVLTRVERLSSPRL